MGYLNKLVFGNNGEQAELYQNGSFFYIDSVDPIRMGNNVTLQAPDGEWKNLTADYLFAELTGNVSGNLTGNVFGNVVGNLTGNITGDLITGGINFTDNITVTRNVSVQDTTCIGNSTDACPAYFKWNGTALIMKVN